MYNFYPGPSKIYGCVKDFAKEAFENGVLEKNHRSDSFMILLAECTGLLKKHLKVPNDYEVFFTSSATECWEICSQSFLSNSQTYFLYNGSFGEKWMQYRNRLDSNTFGESYALNQAAPIAKFSNQNLCLVLNETSNGTAVKPVLLHEKLGESLFVVDAVSSLGGVFYDISKADIWISSVQKCFGLPAGMGIMLVSPKAMLKARSVNDHRFYNSALFLSENFSKNQTPYTPNILGIYLLKRLLEVLPPMTEISEKIKGRAKQIYTFFEVNKSFELLVDNETVRSETVIAVKYPEVSKLISSLENKGVILGKGYGAWKIDTFRIANFPAIEDSEYNFLFEILTTFVKS